MAVSIIVTITADVITTKSKLQQRNNMLTDMLQFISLITILEDSIILSYNKEKSAD